MRVIDLASYVVQDKGVQNAAVQVSGLELGGLLGSLSAGAISDPLVRNNDGSKGNVGLRVQVCPPMPPLPSHAACQTSMDLLALHAMCLFGRALVHRDNYFHSCKVAVPQS